MKTLSKIISILLCCILSFSICACNINPDNSSNPETPPIVGGEPNNGEENNNNEVNDIVQATTMTLSYDYKDYIGDLETFVYGLLINKLEYLYDVFPASVQTSDGYCVYGLGYTDYTDCYTNEDESVAYFKSGFLPFVGELEVSQEDFDSGLFLYNLDYKDEETLFVWAYKSTAFLEHCVVYGAYLKYGVTSDGKITYQAEAFDRDKCDLTLGSLYSYDDSRYLYDVDFGEYMPISGISLAETFDYAEFEKEINAFIEEQNANFTSFDVTSVAYTSQNAVKAYLQSLQEETFLGYSVDQLIEATEDLDPLECFRITPEGLTVVDIKEIPEESSALVKWLVGTACVIATGVGVVTSIITAACPPLSSIAGAITGVAIETFMQVVIDSKSLNSVSWSKVGVAAISGAVSGFLGPYLQTLGGAGYFFIDSTVDGFIGATEQAVFAWMDGNNSEEILSRFGYGFVLGAGISAGFKVAGKVLSKVGQGLSTGAQKIAQKLPPKLTATLSKFTQPIKNLGNSIGDGITKLKQKADSSIFHSKYIARKQTEKQLINIIKNHTDIEELSEKSLKSLRTNGMLDINGVPITKTQLKEIYSTASDGAFIGKYQIQYDDIIEDVYIVKSNSTYSIVFNEKYSTAVLTEGLTLDRTTNFVNAAKNLSAGEWFQNPSKIPVEIKDELIKLYPGRSIEDILEFADSDELSRQIVSIVKKSPYVFHESVDLMSVSLVPRALHDKVNGYNGVSHMGGIGFLKYIKTTFGVDNFGQYVSAAANGVRINLNIDT